MVREKVKAVRESKCEYCGGLAAGDYGSGIRSADGLKFEVDHLWCEKCKKDLTEFGSKPENRLPDFPDEFDFSDPKATQLIQRLEREIEERKKAFMRLRVAERKGLGHAA